VAEEDEADRQPAGPAVSQKPADNSLGRLLTLSDGVFAIAMTLLALDLKVPNLVGHVTNHELVHALAQNTASYWSFILSFYIVGSYWVAHRHLMRSVTTIHPALVRDTLFLLLIVAVTPFPASLLARYASTPFALAVYGAASALATVTLIVLTHDIRRLDPASRAAVTPADDLNLLSSWLNLAVFLLCIPAGYIIGAKGPWVLLLLIVTGRLAMLKKLTHRYRLDRFWVRFKPRPRA
jgi:uncharacterized membrane protein